jgi:hypothetical protein
MIKLKIIKKVLKYPCYCCRQSIRGKTISRKDCKACKGTGFFNDEIFFHIFEKNGKKYCIEGDTIK